jgi:hypothetical protein
VLRFFVVVLRFFVATLRFFVVVLRFFVVVLRFFVATLRLRFVAAVFLAVSFAAAFLFRVRAAFCAAALRFAFDVAIL